MDIVLGVSTEPTSVHLVLVEGTTGGGVTVDEDGFEVTDDAVTFPEQVVSAILGTQESAQQGGYRLTSTGVSVADPRQAGQLRDALAGHRVENVMLVSAFLAAAALAQALGSAVGYERTALMLIEPDAATLGVVDTLDGSIADVNRVTLPTDDSAAVAALTALAEQAGRLSSRPGGLFLVGSGVNIGVVKAELDAASSIPVSVPEEPDTALARGAALASAHAPVLDSSTSALAWARDPGTGMIDPDLVALGYAYKTGDHRTDYDATSCEFALAYSEVPDEPDDDYLAVDAGETMEASTLESGALSAERYSLDAVEPLRHRRPFLWAGSAMAAFFVVGVASLVVALAVGIRPTVHERPTPSQHVIVPTREAPAPQLKQAPAPQLKQAPAPQLKQAPPAPAPPVAVHSDPQPQKAPASAPAPAPAASAPVAVAPVPVPAAPKPVETPAPAAPAPTQPPVQIAPRNDNPSWLPGANGGGQTGELPSPWLPGVGVNGGGNPWAPGGGGHGGGHGGGWPF